MKKVFAHAGEEHETTVEATTHYFEFLQNPYIAILGAVLVGLILYYAMHHLSFKASVRVLVMISYLFVIGILGFLYVPALGVIGVVFGFVATVVVVFSGIKQGTD